MPHSERTRSDPISKNVDMKLEKLKKTAFEIIDHKDKIIKLLYTILEVQGITTLNIKELISNNASINSKDQLMEHVDYGFNTNKKKLSSRKRAILDMQNDKSKKKKKELNIFSTPSKLNNKDLLNDFSKLKSSIVVPFTNDFNIQEHSQLHKEMQNQKLHQDLQQQLKEAMNGNMISAREHNTSLSKNHLESRKRAIENLKMIETKENCDKHYKSDSHIPLCSSRKKKKLNDPKDGDCQLCLMPNAESLHGSFPPLLFQLSCGHVFHLMCLYETITRRECRKTCCICHNELNDEDKNDIIHKVKVEKKKNVKKNKMLLKVMRLQATRE